MAQSEAVITPGSAVALIIEGVQERLKKTGFDTKYRLAVETKKLEGDGDIGAKLTMTAPDGSKIESNVVELSEDYEADIVWIDMTLSDGMGGSGVSLNAVRAPLDANAEKLARRHGENVAVFLTDNL